MARLSDEQRRVLKHLQKHPYSTAEDMRCGIQTMISLSKNGYIVVATTFGGIAYPRKAEATITSAGLDALSARS